MTAWIDRPVPPRILRWFLFVRLDLTLWAAPSLLLFSAVFRGGAPGEFSCGGATAVALLWAMAKLRDAVTKNDQ